MTQNQGSVVSVRQFNLFMSVSTRSHQGLGASIKPYTVFAISHIDDAPVPMLAPVLRSVRSAAPDLQLILARRPFLHRLLKTFILKDPATVRNSSRLLLETMGDAVGLAPNCGFVNPCVTKRAFNESSGFLVMTQRIRIKLWHCSPDLVAASTAACLRNLLISFCFALTNSSRSCGVSVLTRTSPRPCRARAARAIAGVSAILIAS